VVAVGLTILATGLSVVHSKRLANVLDSLSDTRIRGRAKLASIRRSWTEPP
jgi:hypothetical protein